MSSSSSSLSSLLERARALPEVAGVRVDLSQRDLGDGTEAVAMVFHQESNTVEEIDRAETAITNFLKEHVSEKFKWENCVVRIEGVQEDEGEEEEEEDDEEDDE